MDNYLALQVVKESEAWVRHQLQNKEERWFVGEESEIKQRTLWKWAWHLKWIKEKIEKGEEFEKEPNWASIWNLYRFGVSKWPISRIKSRAGRIKNDVT